MVTSSLTKNVLSPDIYSQLLTNMVNTLAIIHYTNLSILIYEDCDQLHLQLQCCCLLIWRKSVVSENSFPELKMTASTDDWDSFN